MNDPVDVVIAWVDGDDSAWLEEKRKFDPSVPLPSSAEHHFRDWGLLRYLFRGIESFMPWVRTVHFVTWGHLPAWLNVSNPKLHVVRHEDYIPSEYLPTFNSHTIELNFHRIEGLSNKFVYFNDDMFALRPTEESDFFYEGLPCDLAALNAHCYSLSRPVDLIQVRDVGVINEHFNFRGSVRANKGKWLRFQNGKELLRTIPLLGCPRFPGFYQTHCAQSLLKSTYEEVWAAEPALLDETCRNKLRGLTDVNQWVLREWQIASGNFHPRNRGFFEPFYLDKTDPLQGAESITETIKAQKRTLICVNDADMSDDAYEKCRSIVADAFECLLPSQSSFEWISDKGDKK